MQRNKMLYRKELKLLQEIEEKYYMEPIIQLIKRDLDDKKISIQDAFDFLYDYLIQSKENVEKLIQKRKANGIIKDENQTRKSIVGNAFSSLIIWLFLKNKDNGNIDKNIFISKNIRAIPNYKELFYIQVGEEFQKPDVDLVVYNLNIKNKIEKCLILSLKTSLRERAGQTYKWKLLMEIAQSESEIKKKYNIEYNPPILPLVCFATVNFYNEINNPQQRGMFKFFDCAFIGKNIKTAEFIKPLSYLIDYIKENFK